MVRRSCLLAAALIVCLLSVVSLAACSGKAAAGAPETVRLGYFPNLTHAPAILGDVKGYFQTELGGVKLATSTYNAGTDAVQAMFSGAIDMAFMGPNPAINAFAQSKGAAVRIVGGCTSGGAALVVREGIDKPTDLAGKKLATPSLGNTQDVALRSWLAKQGLKTTKEGAGDVSILPQSNADTLQNFRAGNIDGAWVPEPWATRLVLEGKGHILVNESDLWPNGQFVTTHLVVNTTFLQQHPEQVKAVLRGLLKAVDYANNSTQDAEAAVNDQLKTLTGKALATDVVSTAWKNMVFTVDPIASSLKTSADNAVAVGLLDPVDLKGIYDLTLLNQVLKDAGRQQVSE